MAVLTPVQIDSTGIAVTYAAASGGGDSVAVGTLAGRAILGVKNGDSGAHVVTIAGAVACSQGSQHNLAVTVGAGAEKRIVIPAHCVDTNGNAAVTYDGVTSVTVSAVYV